MFPWGQKKTKGVVATCTFVPNIQNNGRPSGWEAIESDELCLFFPVLWLLRRSPTRMDHNSTLVALAILASLVQ